MDKAVIKKPDSKTRKWLLIAGLMLAGFSLAFLVAKAARNDLAELAPHDIEIPISVNPSGDLKYLKGKVDK